MAVASLVPRRMAKTSSANAMVKKRRSLPVSPMPRARRASAIVRQSSANNPTIRTPARVPSTNRAGSRKICASPSAIRVGSAPPIRITAALPRTRMRRKTATASSSDRSLTVISHHWKWISPPGRPYSAMLSAPIGATSSSGAVRRISRATGTPQATKTPNWQQSIVSALTQSRVIRIGSDASTANPSRVTGFIRSSRVGAAAAWAVPVWTAVMALPSMPGGSRPALQGRRGRGSPR